MLSKALTRYCWCLLFLLLPLSALRAQFAQWSLSAFTESDGLSSNIVRCVLQDRRGVLWIGTADGLNYYDGYSFNTFRKNGNSTNTIRSNFITKLAEDRAGDIWIGYVSGGISCYNIPSGQFRHFALRDVKDEKNRKTPEVTMLYVDRKNRLWVGVTQGGFFSLDKESGKWTHYDLVNEAGIPLTSSADKMYNTVFAAYEDDHDVMWLATSAGLYRYKDDPATLRPVPNKKKDESGFYQDLMLDMLKKDSTLWTSSWGGGIAGYNMQTHEWARYTFDHNSTTSNIVNALLPMQGDSLLFISNDKGLGSFNLKTGHFYFPKGITAIKAGDYKAIYQDRSGNVWITSNKGLYKLSRSSPKFSFVPVGRKIYNGGAPLIVATVFENDHFRLLGSSYGDGLYVHDKRTNRQWNLSCELLPGEERDLHITDILEDGSGTIWVMTRDYLFYLDKISGRLKKKRQPPLLGNSRSNHLYRMLTDRKDRLWIATLANGVFLYDIKNDVILRHYASDAEPDGQLPVNTIRAITADSVGNIWIGGSRGFLARIDAVSGAVQTYSTYYPASAVNANTVYAILAGDHSTLWAGTDIGLLRYNIRKDDLVFNRCYTSENGISSDIVKSISKASDGKLWCLTETSLCRLDPDNNIAASYGLADGLTTPGIGTRIQQLPGGHMVIPAAYGYYTFDPLYLANLQQSVSILITSFTINGIPRHYGNELAANGVVRLDPSDDQLSFEFANIDFNRTGKQQYAYMLQGLDTGWVSTYNRYAGYGNLKPGDYIFKVRAIGNTNRQDSEIISLPIKVTGHFYTTTWFWLVVAAMVFGIMYFVYAIRLRNQRRIYALRNRAELLEKEKAMVMYESLKQHLNPHFLFNSLTSLGSLIYIDQKLAADFLEGLSKIYRYILVHRDKETVSLGSEVQFCRTYIRLQKTRFEEALQVDLRVDDTCLDLKIAPVTLQNLVENAIKHNIATLEDPLLVEIFVDDEQQLVVRNNLNLKDFVETSNGQGLASLNTLYQYLTGKEIIIEKNDRYFIVKVPLI